MFTSLLEEYDIKDGNNVNSLVDIEDEALVSSN